MSILDQCKVLNFKNMGDIRGNLVVLENKKDIPFEIKRIFYMYGSDERVIRGQHANRNSDFVLINVSGVSDVVVSDGKKQKTMHLDSPLSGIYIPKMLWKEMKNFSSDSVLLVLTNTFYDKDEYIRDYDEYLNAMVNYD